MSGIVKSRLWWTLVRRRLLYSFPWQKKLGIWERHVHTREQVHYANGVTEPILGVVPLDFTLQAWQMSTQAHVLHSKSPALILGFPFLEAQGLLVDCQGRQLIPKAPWNPLPCLPSMIQSGLAMVNVKRFCIDGQMPLMPPQKHQLDVGADIFAPRSIHIRPGQQALVDMGLACTFLHTHWCLLKDKSSLALRHGLTVLRGGVDSNYCGRIQVILHNLGSSPVTIPNMPPCVKRCSFHRLGAIFRMAPLI